jgi:ribonuclease BN (tRNA processing enzyme)
MIRDADVVIHDAQYSWQDLKNGKKGWGHSAWEDVVHLAKDARVGQLFLFHHDPDMTDAQLNERQYRAQQIFPCTRVAREGLKVPLTTCSAVPRARAASSDTEHGLPESETHSGVVNLNR